MLPCLLTTLTAPDAFTSISEASSTEELFNPVVVPTAVSRVGPKVGGLRPTGTVPPEKKFEGPVSVILTGGKVRVTSLSTLAYLTVTVVETLLF